MIEPTPIWVGGHLKYSAHFSAVLRASYFPHFCDHVSKTANPAPPLARQIAMPTTFQVSQSTSSLGMTASAANNNSSSASHSLFGTWRVSAPFAVARMTSHDGATAIAF